MKQLTICRHAKSSWSQESLKDFDRPLNPRGYRNAHEMGAYLLRQNLQPDYVISSPARRAIETAKIITDELGSSEQINQDSRIYEASVADLQSVIEALPDGKSAVILFGHNPGLESLCNFIDPGSIATLTTCNIATYQLEIEHWNDFDFSCGKLLHHTTPKKLKQ